jgi:hypothetical protein
VSASSKGKEKEKKNKYCDVELDDNGLEGHRMLSKKGCISKKLKGKGTCYLNDDLFLSQCFISKAIFLYFVLYRYVSFPSSL